MRSQKLLLSNFKEFPSYFQLEEVSISKSFLDVDEERFNDVFNEAMKMVEENRKRKEDKIRKDKKFKKWTSENKYNENDFIIKKKVDEGKTIYTMFKKISKLEL